MDVPARELQRNPTARLLFYFLIQEKRFEKSEQGGWMCMVFIQQVINGLAQGGIYALIAIGWTTVFGIVGVMN